MHSITHIRFSMDSGRRAVALCRTKRSTLRATRSDQTLLHVYVCIKPYFEGDGLFSPRSMTLLIFSTRPNLNHERVRFSFQASATSSGRPSPPDSCCGSRASSRRVPLRTWKSPDRSRGRRARKNAQNQRAQAREREGIST